MKNEYLCKIMHKQYIVHASSIKEAKEAAANYHIEAEGYGSSSFEYFVMRTNYQLRGTVDTDEVKVEELNARRNLD